MEFSYDINKTTVDKKANNCLLTCHMLSMIINLFVSTFLVAYIYSFNGDTYAYIFNVGVYNLFVYITFFISYIPLSFMVEKSNRISFYRLSIILKGVLVVIIIFFGKQLSKLLILAGILHGLGESLYYTSYNVIREEMVGRKTMDKYTSISYVFNRMIEVVCPILLGALIDITTFSQTAIIVLVICITQLIVSLGIRSQKPKNSHFSLKEYFQSLRTKPEAKKKVVFLYIISFIYGTTTMITTAINVCIMLQYGSNLSLGTITGIFCLISIFALLLMKKFTVATKRSWLMWTCAILTVISSIIFAIVINSITLIILNATISILAAFYKCLFDLYRNSILKESGLYDNISEHHTMVESLINAARIITFGLFMLIGFIKSIILFKVYMVLVITISSLMIILLAVYEKKFVIAKTQQTIITANSDINLNK